MAFKIRLADGEETRLPDFKLPVSFTMVNGEEAKVVFTVKHVSSDEVQALYKREDIKDTEFLTELATGWDLEDEFNEKHIARLVSLFPSAVLSLTRAYMAALAGVRVKN